MRVAEGTRVRNIALLVGVSQYPNLPHSEWLPAAHIDIARLQQFLTSDQDFDEVIVLEDADASPDNIRYFLSQYIPRRLQVYGDQHVRVFIAYSGHGVSFNTEGSDAALVLSGAQPTAAPYDPNVMRLNDLRSMFEDIATHSYQVVALINACYGAGIFREGRTGGSDFTPNRHGAHAVTAGSANNRVWTSPDASKGSIFFDAFITSVQEIGQQRQQRGRVVNGYTGDVVQDGNAFALGSVIDLVADRMRDMPPTPQYPDGVPPPWMGSILPNQASEGAFFFITPRREHLPDLNPVHNVASFVDHPVRYVTAPVRGFFRRVVSGPIVASAGPVSAVPGRPELRVFNPPDQYPIHGISVSAEDVPLIDWAHLHNASQFAYVRIDGDNPSPVNLAALQRAREAGVPVGLYYVLSPCRSGDAQISSIEAVAPANAWSLPPVVDFDGRIDSGDCGSQQPMSRRDAQHLLHDLDDDYAPIETAAPGGSGRITLVRASRRGLAGMLASYPLRVLGVRSDNASDSIPSQIGRYPKWVSDFSTPGDTAAAPGFPGPWTIWQYQSDVSVAGVPHPAHLLAFFGTEDQFASFASGASDVAESQ